VILVGQIIKEIGVKCVSTNNFFYWNYRWIFVSKFNLMIEFIAVFIISLLIGFVLGFYLTLTIKAINGFIEHYFK
jgi:ABC-type multidrug transport system permease subunit